MRFWTRVEREKPACRAIWIFYNPEPMLQYRSKKARSRERHREQRQTGPAIFPVFAGDGNQKRTFPPYLSSERQKLGEVTTFRRCWRGIRPAESHVQIRNSQW